MLFGVTSAHIRMLCENPWNGGFGYDPNQVALMTLDQIVRLLTPVADFGLGSRKKTVKSDEAITLTDDSGFIKGRDKDGNLIKGQWYGKSLAQRIREGEIQGQPNCPLCNEEAKPSQPTGCRHCDGKGWMKPNEKDETPRQRRRRLRAERRRRAELEKLIQDTENGD